MIYPKNFEQKIGFDVVRHEILRRCVSPMGISCAERMQFSARFDDVRRWLTQTNEFLAILQSKREFPLNFFFDLRAPLRTIATPGTYLTAENLFNLQRSLNTVGQIIDFFKPEDDEPSPPLPASAAEVPGNRRPQRDVQRGTGGVEIGRGRTGRGGNGVSSEPNVIAVAVV
ncbi:MAG: hypothetical protein II683_04250, partial [Muribaculaceae bacterium]|nr:hypothetical protein [Muribaculaceae bacterium]